MKTRLTILIALFLSALTLKAQSYEISGQIVDSDGLPLAGVGIVEAGTVNGTMSDIDGLYNIALKQPATLEFSCIGMKTVRKTVDSAGVLNIRMEYDAIGLEEVITIGYGSVKKEELTTAVSRVKSDDFIKGGVNTPLQLLQGKVAGLGMSTTSGDPGGSVSMTLRGISTLAASTEPLIVIDGIAGGSLNSVSAEDIESIDVLKDGSAAAIYGTRGTNGVIIINTKKPQDGKLSLEYHTYVKFDKIIEEKDYVNADMFREYAKNPAFEGMVDGGASTDWVKEVTRNPISQLHYISAQGGNKATTYNVSATYDDRDGIYKTSFDKSLAVKALLTHSMYNDKIRLVANFSNRSVNHGNAADDLYSKALLRNPTLPIYNEDGSYFENSNGANPVELLNEYKGVNNYNQLAVSGMILFKPIDNLTLSATGTYQNDYNEYEWSHTHKAYDATMGSQKGGATLSGGHGDDRTFELQADYSLRSGKHSLSATGGYSFNRYIHQRWSMSAFNFPIDGFGAWNIGSAESIRDGLSDMSSYKWQRTLIGFYGRANYNYDNRYLVMASVRREGSDKFGKNNRWGWFPAISASWRMNNESFLKDIDWLDELKLRLGYGVTGTEPSSPYQYISLYNFNPSYMSYSGGNWISGIIPSNNPNDNLKWEEKHELNAGVDFAFLEGRVSGSMDAYYRYTKDLLYTYTVPTPPNITSSILANVGAISNKGVEMSLNLVPVRTKDMNLTIHGTISYNTNKLEQLSNDLYQLEYLTLGELEHVQTYSHRLEEGWSIGNFYGWKALGLRSNGKAWRIEGAENSTAGEDQKTILGNGIPKMFASLSADFSYKRFEATMSFHGAFLYQILNQYRMKYETLAWLSSANLPKSAFEKAGDYYNYAPSTYCDRYVENGDYMKLDNITVGYNFNTGKFEIIKAAKIYISARNLLTFTKYSGLDPEAVNITGLTPGIDSIDKYPTLTSFCAGLNITF